MLGLFLNHQTKNIISAAFILAITTLLAKALSLIRLRVFTSLFNTGELDIYFAAFRIPDLLYNVLILGAVSTAFIPIFSEYWKRDKKEAWKLCNNVLCSFLFFLALFAILFAIFTPKLMGLVAPGFEGEKMDTAIDLTRLLFLSPLIFGVSSIFSSVLQYFSRFLAYSLAPVMYNVGIIFGAVFFEPSMGIMGLGWGVILGAFLHLLIQIPAVFISGFKFNFIFNFKDSGMKRILKLMIPRSIGLAANQINLIVITAIASTIAAGSIAIFNISNDLQYIPISLFGISFAIAVFPSLSRSVSDKEKKDFFGKFISAFSQILFFSLPFSILFFVLRAQIVRIIPGSENFEWEDTRLTVACLGLFAFSIFAQSLIPLVARAFYSMQDTKTPVRVSIISIIFNIIFCFFFVELLSFPNPFYYFLQSLLSLENASEISVIGLPLAFSLSSIINLILLLILFKKKIGNGWDLTLGNTFLRLSILSVFCGGVSFSLLYFFVQIYDHQGFWGIFFQTVFSGGIGLILYIYIAKLLKFPEYKAVSRSLFRKISEPTEEIET